MPRAWVWWHLSIAWLPVWALFATLMAVAHDMSPAQAAPLALRLVACAAVLGLVVHRATQRWPWPHPFRIGFVARHALAAALFSVAWIGLNSVVESLVRLRMAIVLGPGLVPFLITGVWMYVMVAGVGYAQAAAEREVQLKAAAARSQLAALRAQLHPHFLFNALHTVVQLIPLDPKAAAGAAEQLAALLRSTLEEQRDEVTLAEEWQLVQRYLALESIRFGDRLRVSSAIDDDVQQAAVPSFALQTLVENAVRHAATPSVQATQIKVSARRAGHALLITVADSGASTDLAALLTRTDGSRGTGLLRLREQLRALYGDAATLDFELTHPHGVSARLRLLLAWGLDDA